MNKITPWNTKIIINTRQPIFEKKYYIYRMLKKSVNIRFTVLAVLIIAAAGLYSCRHAGNHNISQGEIHYSIEYYGDIGFAPKEYMPKTLVVSFKDDKILFEISSMIGNSGILNLSNPEQDIFDTYFSLFTLRYAYSAKPGETHPGFEGMTGIEINKTSKTNIICGFNCKNAQVIIPGTDKVYDIWYTDEINVKNPNNATPYNVIDGVLMEFFFVMGETEMHFTAENVYRKEVSDKTFERKNTYKFVSREQINELIGKMGSI